MGREQRKQELKYHYLGQSLEATLLMPLKVGEKQRLQGHDQVAKLELERGEVSF